MGKGTREVVARLPQTCPLRSEKVVAMVWFERVGGTACGRSRRDAIRSRCVLSAGTASTLRASVMGLATSYHSPLAKDVRHGFERTNGLRRSC